LAVGVLAAGVLTAGVLTAGVLTAGVMAARVLAAGVLAAGVLTPGWEGVEGELGLRTLGVDPLLVHCSVELSQVSGAMQQTSPHSSAVVGHVPEGLGAIQSVRVHVVPSAQQPPPSAAEHAKYPDIQLLAVD